MRKLDEERGFTLVELIVVLVILAVLAAILVPTLIGYIDQARHQKDYATAGQLEQAAQAVVIEQQQEVRDKNNGGRQWTYAQLNPVCSGDGMRTKGKREKDEVLELAGIDKSKVKWFYFNVDSSGSVTSTIQRNNPNQNNRPSGSYYPTSVGIDDTVYYLQSNGSWASSKVENGRFTTTALDVYDYSSNSLKAKSSSTSWNLNSKYYLN